MTDSELKKLEELCNAATKGPWNAVFRGAYTRTDDVVTAINGLVESVCADLHSRDSNFIAASRDAVPKLIAEIRKHQDHFEHCQSSKIVTLSLEVQKLRAALEFYADKENWDAENVSPTVWEDGDIDLGARARAALGVSTEQVVEAFRFLTKEHKP